MSGKTFYFYTTEHIDKVVNVFDFSVSGVWNGSLADKPDPDCIKFQYYKFVYGQYKKEETSQSILFGVVQMNCRKTSESISSYFARNFGIFKVVFSRVLSPIILPHLKMQFIVNNMMQFPECWEVMDFKECGNFELGGGHRNVKSEISAYFLMFENQLYFEKCIKGRDKLAIVRMNEFSDNVGDRCISIDQIENYYI